MGKSGCCTFCGIFSFIGALFFGASSLMVVRQNKAFLSHKAGMDLTDLNQEDLDTKFWAIISAAIVRKFSPLFSVSFQFWLLFNTAKLLYVCVDISNSLCDVPDFWLRFGGKREEVSRRRSQK